jgi:hypothetical protein
VSEELVLLKEYMWGMGIDKKVLTNEDLVNLISVLKDVGEYGLARFVEGLSGPEELLEYVGTEEE